MTEKIKTVIRFICTYGIQVGALWSFLEGYTYFKNNVLKNFLGSFWILIYIIPLVTTTIYILVRKAGKNNEAGKDDIEEDIQTLGNYSPGKVNGHYTVRKQSENPGQTVPSDVPPVEKIKNGTDKKTGKSIHTEGNYCPGEVGGNYTVEE
ncbi:MAG: hypothetical protein JXJ04_19790 [Spirochaetales bacterium]|nr:hypothetical protein [Spirochaetales bacterium]